MTISDAEYKKMIDQIVLLQLVEGFVNKVISEGNDDKDLQFIAFLLGKRKGESNFVESK